jgi:myo-inositol-1(or 4)-monophosphatase
VSDPEDLLELAAELAHTAGALLRERARGGAEAGIASKSTPTDLVSEADLASERAIRELLAARRPEDGFVGEEGGSAAGAGSGLVWIVDPLDGTINFLFGIPQWCVSVAVADADGELAGVVYDPNREELFCATRGGDARLQAGDRQPTRLRGRQSPVAPPGAPADEHGGLASAMVATGLFYDAVVRAAQAEVLARLVGRVRDVRRFGSAALDLAWTAAGRYDAYFERGVQPWDVAGGALICRRAGLSVVELEPDGELPEGILVARRTLVEPLLDLVGRA